MVPKNKSPCGILNCLPYELAYPGVPKIQTIHLHQVCSVSTLTEYMRIGCNVCFNKAPEILTLQFVNCCHQLIPVIYSVHGMPGSPAAAIWEEMVSKGNHADSHLTQDRDRAEPPKKHKAENRQVQVQQATQGLGRYQEHRSGEETEEENDGNSGFSDMWTEEGGHERLSRLKTRKGCVYRTLNPRCDRNDQWAPTREGEPSDYRVHESSFFLWVTAQTNELLSISSQSGGKSDFFQELWRYVHFLNCMHRSKLACDWSLPNRYIKIKIIQARWGGSAGKAAARQADLSQLPRTQVKAGENSLYRVVLWHCTPYTE